MEAATLLLQERADDGRYGDVRQPFHPFWTIFYALSQIYVTPHMP